MANTLDAHPLGGALNELIHLSHSASLLQNGVPPGYAIDHAGMEEASAKWISEHSQKLLSTLVGDHLGALPPRPRPLMLVCAEALFMRIFSRVVEDEYSRLASDDVIDEYEGDRDAWEDDIAKAVDDAEGILGASLAPEVTDGLLCSAGYYWGGTSAKEPSDSTDT